MQYAPTLPAGGPSGTRQTSPVSADAPGKLGRRPRGLGKCQTSCFKESEASESVKQVVSRFPRPRKGPNKLFQGIRGLGKAQTSCFKVSEASERLKQVVSRFPRRRKGPNKLFQGFRRLGKAGKPVGYIKSPYPASFPASAEAVRRRPRQTWPASLTPQAVFIHRIKNYHS